jgi:D-glycerate 3-kinase
MSLWPQVQQPVDVVLLEGWMLGFQPVPESSLTDRHLLQINTLLQDYTDWHRQLDSFVYLRPQDASYVIDWRTEAESRMKAKGLPGMSDEEVRAYAEKFLPAYHLYGPALASEPSITSSFLQIVIGKNRLPV